MYTFVNAKSSGKSTLIANLGVNLAKELAYSDTSAKVLIVDLNIDTPDIAYIFNLIDETKKQYPTFLDELFRYLTSGEEFNIDWAITPSKNLPNLSFICGTRELKDEFANLGEHHWQSLIDKLKDFDYVLVDTSRYHSAPLFKVLFKASEKLIIVQDQDLFGISHTALMLRFLDKDYSEKSELWVSRYEPHSPIKPDTVQDLIGLEPRYLIPGMPRKAYIQTLYNEKPLEQRFIPNYSDKLALIADEMTGVAPKGGKAWKLMNLKKG